MWWLCGKIDYYYRLFIVSYLNLTWKALCWQRSSEECWHYSPKESVFVCLHQQLYESNRVRNLQSQAKQNWKKHGKKEVHNNIQNLLVVKHESIDICNVKVCCVFWKENLIDGFVSSHRTINIEFKIKRGNEMFWLRFSEFSEPSEGWNVHSLFWVHVFSNISLLPWKCIFKLKKKYWGGAENCRMETIFQKCFINISFQKNFATFPLNHANSWTFCTWKKCDFQRNLNELCWNEQGD